MSDSCGRFSASPGLHTIFDTDHRHECRLSLSIPYGNVHQVGRRAIVSPLIRRRPLIASSALEPPISARRAEGWRNMRQRKAFLLQRIVAISYDYNNYLQPFRHSTPVADHCAARVLPRTTMICPSTISRNSRSLVGQHPAVAYKTTDRSSPSRACEVAAANNCQSIVKNRPRESDMDGRFLWPILSPSAATPGSTARRVACPVRRGVHAQPDPGDHGRRCEPALPLPQRTHWY